MAGNLVGRKSVHQGQYSMNRIAQLQDMAGGHELWKFGHYYTPNMLGFIGYNSYNTVRRPSVYHTRIRMHDVCDGRHVSNTSRRKSRTRSKTKVIKKVIRVKAPPAQVDQSGASTAVESSTEVVNQYNLQVKEMQE